MTWLEEAKKLPIGGRRRVHCCQPRKTAVLSRNGWGYHFFCFSQSCSRKEDVPDQGRTLSQILSTRDTLTRLASSDWRIPEDIDLSMSSAPLEARSWIYGAGVSERLRLRCWVGWSERLKRVVLPCSTPSLDADGAWQQVPWTARAVLPGMKPRYLPKPTIPWSSSEFFRTTEASCLVVTEDILSALRVAAAAERAKFPLLTWSIHGARLSPSCTARILDLSPRAVVLWLDGDKAGRRGAQAARRSLMMAGVDVRIVQTEKDPKHYCNDDILKHLEVLTEEKC